MPPAKKPQLNLTELGVTGLSRASGLVFEEFLPQLQGKNLVKIVREMRDNDPIVGAILFAVDKSLRGVDWTVEAGSDLPEDQDAAEFLDSCMTDMATPWSDVISEILSMLPFGWSLLELVYKKRQGQKSDPGSKFDDGKIGWRKLPLRAQESFFKWDFDDEGGIQGMVQQGPPDWKMVNIPIEKALLFRTTAHKNNPEGRSLLRNAYRPWYFKKRIEEIEGVGVERDLAGFPVMYVDPRIMAEGRTEAEAQIFEEYKNIVTRIRRDQQEGLILPSLYDENGRKMYEFALLSSAGQRQFNTNEIVTRYNTQIAMTILADFVMLGHRTTGSFALSDAKTSLFVVALQAFLDTIADVFNDYAVPRLFALNGLDLDTLPKLTHGKIEPPDLAELGTYLTALANAGVPLFPNEELEKYLLTIAHMPLKSEAQQQLQQMTDMVQHVRNIEQVATQQSGAVQSATAPPPQIGGTPPKPGAPPSNGKPPNGKSPSGKPNPFQKQ